MKKMLFSIPFALLFILQFAPGTVSGIPIVPAECVMQTYDSLLADLPGASMTAGDCPSTYLLAAPHGGFDTNTESILYGVIETVPWDFLAAEDYRNDDIPINVNRPTEGVGLSWEDELFTDRAALVYQAYLDQFDTIRSQELRLYVEIHGQSKSGREKLVDVATVGISRAKARRIKSILNSEIGAYFPGVKFLVEGVDNIYYTAQANKRFGILAEIATAVPGADALHMEMPYQMRSAANYGKTVAFFKSVLPRLVAEEY